MPAPAAGPFTAVTRAGQIAQPADERMKHRLQRLPGAARYAVFAAPLQVGAGRKGASGAGQHQASRRRLRGGQKVERVGHVLDHGRRQRVQDVRIVHAQDGDRPVDFQVCAFKLHACFHQSSWVPN
jgi:hypothetical protein